ncbi:MAG: hypothetical protein H7146_10750 [Burkholderiaceae bacterium]|nr:hypothetical protein [Microbacteriaceae bacterium]
MSPITRTWLAFAAIGAGLVHLALVISSPAPFAVVLVGLGIAEFGWGVLTFARANLPAPRLVRVVAIVPLLAWSLLAVAAGVFHTPWLVTSLPLMPMAVAGLFELFAAAAISVHLRRSPGVVRPAPGSARYLAALMGGAVVVGLMTAPALAGTESGRHAQPHGSHDATFAPASSVHPGH